MPSIGTPELIIGLIVVFLLFGAKRMPDMARGIGQSLRIFKTEMQQRPAEAGTTPAPTTQAPPVTPDAPVPPTADTVADTPAAPAQPATPSADPQPRPTP
ncbi:twin-arginine translocase TatA/TatE family subunit [Jiangella asiatica]|uniref:Sec-independent protein translocase protein TatA n=1 Tax=Jiangella asiatica TaxID=2530372 RepID=A0A4V6PFN4_9ACTN|nr:twin-arginine translocase TatA/TatE family subunit [Jiangella asiatica]TDE10408.1 twin-arginine translocase TatA/TatE family subunit [Jiangella asiatica]